MYVISRRHSFTEEWYLPIKIDVINQFLLQTLLQAPLRDKKVQISSVPIKRSVWLFAHVFQ